jgi:hypothetical protein
MLSILRPTNDDIYELPKFRQVRLIQISTSAATDYNRRERLSPDIPQPVLAVIMTANTLLP